MDQKIDVAADVTVSEKTVSHRNRLADEMRKNRKVKSPMHGLRSSRARLTL